MSKANLLDELYEQVLIGASKAAEAGALEWWQKVLKQGPAFVVIDRGAVVGKMFDACGFVWIESTDKRDPFWKWGKAKHGWSHDIPIQYTDSNRQDMGVKEYACGAAVAYLKKVGIQKIRLRSAID